MGDSLLAFSWFLINFNNNVNVSLGKSFPDIHVAFFYIFGASFLLLEFIERAKTKFYIPCEIMIIFQLFSWFGSLKEPYP